MPAPEIQPGAIIKVGNIPAVVCAIPEPGQVHVIYRDARHRVIGEDVVWREEAWTFKAPGLEPGWFADRTPRLQEFVAILEAYHKPPVRDFMTRLNEKKKRK
jgi:hypothetical protein